MSWPFLLLYLFKQKLTTAVGGANQKKNDVSVTRHVTFCLGVTLGLIRMKRAV